MVGTHGPLFHAGHAALGGAPQAEHAKPRGPGVHKTGRARWAVGLAGVVWLTIGLGLCVNGLAVTISRTRFGEAYLPFWISVVVPFAILTIILLAARPSPRLRVLVVSAVGLYPSIIYRMSSPLVLGGYDEHLHEQELLNLLHGSGLFAPNPMLTVGPNYPGLEIFTGIVVRLSGLPVIEATILVPLLCRLLLVLILYNATLTISPSRRVASGTVIFYALSPQFYFFNSQFAYQTMALTLGLGGIYLLRRGQIAESSTDARRFSRAANLVLLATVVTHHVTSWLVFTFLLAWTICTPSPQRKLLTRATLIMGAAVVCWNAIIANRLVAYLGPVFAADLQQFKGFIGGSSQRQVFGTANDATVTPHWERLVLISYALCCAVAAIVCIGMLFSLFIRTRNRRVGLLGCLCLGAPISLATHFVPAAADLGDRSSTFFFLPLALALSLVVMRNPHVVGNTPRKSKHLSATFLVLIGLITISYSGALILGSGPDWARLPGPYLVSADPRTQDPETLAAVRWAEAHLAPGSRIVADRVPAALLESEARMWPVTAPAQGLEPGWLYFSATWSSYQTAIVKGLHINYLYVDRRLAESLPNVGYYFYPGETPTPRRITNQDLDKFTHVPELVVVYHHGPVTIYSTAGFNVPASRAGFIGYRTMGLGVFGDAALGSFVVLLFLILRQRFAGIESGFVAIGAIGSAVMVIASAIFIGAILFELRSMPGPSFSIGAIITLFVVRVSERIAARRRLMPLIPVPQRFDLLIVPGLIVCVAGIVISIHAAWSTDVSAVDAILREVAKQ